jgi:selT/selW/selH-like putative selenoprotein
LKAELEKTFSGIEVKLIEGGGGIFDVKKEGQLIFSKKLVGRFPEHEEIIEKLK